eukprot:Skav226983  [mRNA]  locus=scaffold1937:59006:63755:+ [translate_table: standard]
MVYQYLALAVMLVRLMCSTFQPVLCIFACCVRDCTSPRRNVLKCVVNWKWRCVVRPRGVLAIGTFQQVYLFDLLALRAEEVPLGEEPTWPLVSLKLRRILSQQDVLKVVWGGIEELVDIAIELGLGIARTLKPNEKDPVGPVLNSESLFQELLPDTPWPSIFRRVLGLRLCLEEEGSNWSRRRLPVGPWVWAQPRPLRCSQLHHAACVTWTKLPVLFALCAKTRLVKEAQLRAHVCIQRLACATPLGRGLPGWSIGLFI